MGGFSPEIELIKYQRDEGQKDPEIEEYKIDGIDMERASDHPKCQMLGSGWIQVLSSPCDVYINHTSAHVREGAYGRLNMMIIRDHVVDTISSLNEDGVIDGISRVR